MKQILFLFLITSIKLCAQDLPVFYVREDDKIYIWEEGDTEFELLQGINRFSKADTIYTHSRNVLLAARKDTYDTPPDYMRTSFYIQNLIADKPYEFILLYNDTYYLDNSDYADYITPVTVIYDPKRFVGESDSNLSDIPTIVMNDNLESVKYFWAALAIMMITPYLINYILKKLANFFERNKYKYWL